MSITESGLRTGDTFVPQDCGVPYDAIEDLDLRVTMKAGELVRLTAQTDMVFMTAISSRGIDFSQIFGTGEESGINLDFVVEKIVQADGIDAAIRVLNKTLADIGQSYHLNGDRDDIAGDLAIKLWSIEKAVKDSKRPKISSGLR